jgi:hypothetical protein
LHGDVLELGFGSGFNLPYLPAEVTGVWAVDPSGVAMKLAMRRIAESPVSTWTPRESTELVRRCPTRGSIRRCRR